MRCTDVAAVLDSHRVTRLTSAERAQIDAHLAACGDCAAAWHAHAELTALRVPDVPVTLLERALLASRLPQSAPARRARMPVIIGSIALAGAAAAAATYVNMTREIPAPASSSKIEPAAPATLNSASVLAASLGDTAPTLAEDDTRTSVELVELALAVQPVVRATPTYPPGPLEEGLAGHVQLKFDVTAAGTVENVTVVESSDSRFEEQAVQALAEWRYLPRISAGNHSLKSGNPGPPSTGFPFSRG